MNKYIIESLKDYTNTEKRIIAKSIFSDAKEYLIHSEDTEFVNRLNLSLKCAMSILSDSPRGKKSENHR